MATPKRGRPRVLEDAHPATFYLPERVHRQLCMYTEISDDNRSEAIRKAWKMFVRRLPPIVREVVEGA